MLVLGHQDNQTKISQKEMQAQHEQILIFDILGSCRRWTIIRNVIRNEGKDHTTEVGAKKMEKGARNGKNKIVTPFMALDSKENGQKQSGTKIGTKTSTEQYHTVFQFLILEMGVVSGRVNIADGDPRIQNMEHMEP